MCSNRRYRIWKKKKKKCSHSKCWAQVCDSFSVNVNNTTKVSTREDSVVYWSLAHATSQKIVNLSPKPFVRLKHVPTCGTLSEIQLLLLKSCKLILIDIFRRYSCGEWLCNWRTKGLIYKTLCRNHPTCDLMIICPMCVHVIQRTDVHTHIQKKCAPLFQMWNFIIQIILKLCVAEWFQISTL